MICTHLMSLIQNASVMIITRLKTWNFTSPLQMFTIPTASDYSTAPTTFETAV